MKDAGVFLELLEITFRNEEEGVLYDAPKCTKNSVKVVKELRLKHSKSKKATEYAKKGKIFFVFLNFYRNIDLFLFKKERFFVEIVASHFHRSIDLCFITFLALISPHLLPSPLAKFDLFLNGFLHDPFGKILIRSHVKLAQSKIYVHLNKI